MWSVQWKQLRDGIPYHSIKLFILIYGTVERLIFNSLHTILNWLPSRTEICNTLQVLWHIWTAFDY